MSKFPFVLAAGIHLIPALPASADAPAKSEIAELRQQIDQLRSTVHELQDRMNQSRLAPVFHSEHSARSDANGADTGPQVPAFPPGRMALAEEHPLTLDLSVAVDLVGSYAHRADNLNFIARDVEVEIAAKVDSLARGYVVLNGGTELDPVERHDPFEEASVGVEEAAIETTALPFGLRLKAGQFFANVTRLGPVHSHELPFTDRPRSLDALIGGETKARGIEVDWVPPTASNVRFSLGVVDRVGSETGVLGRYRTKDGEEEPGLFAERRDGGRGFGELTTYGRVGTSFTLGKQATLELGANVIIGNDAGRRRLVSGDFLVSWIPATREGDLFEIGGEFLSERQSGDFSEDALESLARGDSARRMAGTARGTGGYVYAQYRVGRSFQPGIRVDYLRADEFAETDNCGATGLQRRAVSTTNYSAYANFYVSDSHRLRLQVSYLRGSERAFTGNADDWQAFLQWTVTLGEEHQREEAH